MLDGVTDPHNLGACLRSADAFGAHAVIVPKDRAVGVNATVAKAASGAADTVPVITVTNLPRALRELKERGVWLLGADAGGESLFDADLSGPVAWVLGAEGSGLRRLTRELCDRIVGIPLAGSVESLNVSVAAGHLPVRDARARSAQPWPRRRAVGSRCLAPVAASMRVASNAVRPSVARCKDSMIANRPVRSAPSAVARADRAGRRAGWRAKGTLVYCSEGSPEGFQPQFFSTGTTFDAVSVPMFNRLVEFETGTTNIVPALAESWTVSPDGKVVHVQAAQGRQVPQQRQLQADARLQRRRRDVLVEPHGRRQPSVPQDAPPARRSRTSTTWA